VLFLFLLISGIPELVNGIYFMLEEGEQKCFLEEVPKDTLVAGRYRTEDEVQSQQVFAEGDDNKFTTKLTVRDPESNVVLQRDLTTQGRFAFTSQIGGEHILCFSTGGGRWFGTKQKTKLHLNMETGQRAIDYEELAKQEHLTSLELQVKKLNDRIKDIRDEQSYQKGREIVFRETSESTSSRLFWWSILQTFALIIIGFWQIRYLKHFLKVKKLV